MMKTLTAFIAALLLVPSLVFAQATTNAGGTGVKNVAQGSILFGTSAFNIRMGTSSALQWNDTLSRLTATNASTTVFTTGTSYLGNVLSGVWQGSTIGISKGGTNSTSFNCTGGIIFYSGTALTDSASCSLLFDINNTRLAINDATPDFRFESVGSSGSGYFGITNSSDGDIFKIDANGLVTLNSASTTAITATNASTTLLVVSGLGGSGTRCVQVGADGTLSASAAACGTGSGGSSDFSVASTFGTTSAATTSSIWSQGVFFSSSTKAASQLPYSSSTMITTDKLWISGFPVATTTTVCANGCSYTSIQAAWDAGWDTVTLKNETYVLSAPLLIPRSNMTVYGNGALIQFNRGTVRLGMMSGNLGTAITNLVIYDTSFQATGASTGGTCFDFSHIEKSHFFQLNCYTAKTAFIASSSLASFYNTFYGSDISIDGGYGSPNTSTGFDLRDSAAIETTIINPRIRPLSSMSSSTCFYIDSHDVTIIKGDCESNALYGLYVTGDGSRLNGNMYLEANQTNAHFDLSTSQVGGYNLTGNIADGTTANIDDDGATGLCINATVQYAAANYCTNTKQGYNTKNPTTDLTIGDTDGNTPSLTNQTLGLFGSRGPGLTIRKAIGERTIVNGSNSRTAGTLDFVLSTTTLSNENQGVRFVMGNAIGTNDVIVQPEVDGNGYGIFEAFSSTSISSIANTAISSRNAPITMAPNRNPFAYFTTNNRFGISTTSPAAALGVEGSQFITGNITSTSSRASVFPYASTTAITSSGSAYLATAGGTVGIATTTPRFPLQIASATSPQIALSAGDTDSAFVLRTTATGLSIASSSPLTFATTTSSSMFAVATSGAVSFGPGSVPQPVLGTYFRDQDGTGPRLYYGGNSGGDTNYVEGRLADNDGNSDDPWYFGTGEFGSQTSSWNIFATWLPNGNYGLASTTPWVQFSQVSAQTNGFITWVVSSVYNTIRPIYSLFASTNSGLSTTTGMTINATSTMDAMTVSGSVHLSPRDGCRLLESALMSGDQTTDAGMVSSGGSPFCGGEFSFDINADGRLRGTTGVDSGQPIYRNIDVGVSAGAGINQFAIVKSNLAGSATSSPSIAIEAQIRLPNVTTATTAVEYMFGWTDAPGASQSLSTTYTAPTNGCYLTATSSANLRLVAVKNSVITMVDSSISTSSISTNFHLLRVGMNSTGCFVAMDNVMKTYLPTAVLPTATLRGLLGLALNASTTPGQGRMQVGQLWMYSGEIQ